MAKAATMLRVKLSPLALDDIREALEWSDEHFGARAAARYRNLIQQAIEDVAASPERAGSRARPELAAGIRTYHLSLSRNRAASAATVRRPRHFLVYRLRQGRLDVVRLLHDSRELARHIPTP